MPVRGAADLALLPRTGEAAEEGRGIGSQHGAQDLGVGGTCQPVVRRGLKCQAGLPGQRLQTSIYWWTRWGRGAWVRLACEAPPQPCRPVGGSGEPCRRRPMRRCAGSSVTHRGPAAGRRRGRTSAGPDLGVAGLCRLGLATSRPRPEVSGWRKFRSPSGRCRRARKR